MNDNKIGVSTGKLPEKNEHIYVHQFYNASIIENEAAVDSEKNIQTIKCAVQSSEEKSSIPVKLIDQYISGDPLPSIAKVVWKVQRVWLTHVDQCINSIAGFVFEIR